MSTVSFVVGYVLTVIGIIVIGCGVAWLIMKVIDVVSEEEKK